MTEPARLSREDSSKTLNDRAASSLQQDPFANAAPPSDKVDKQLFYQYINSSNNDLLA